MVVAGALQTPQLLRGGSEIAREILTASWLLDLVRRSVRVDRFSSRSSEKLRVKVV